MKPDLSIRERRSDGSELPNVCEFRLRDLYLSPALAAHTLLSLFKARLTLGRLSGGDIVTLNSEFEGKLPPGGVDEASAEVYRDQVTVAIRYLARFVPWRSDCVVQALAARNMLKSRGIPSEIRVGAKPLPDTGIDAHAWLVSNGRVITGAHSQDYPVLVGTADTYTEDGRDTYTEGD